MNACIVYYLCIATLILHNTLLSRVLNVNIMKKLELFRWFDIVLHSWILLLDYHLINCVISPIPHSLQQSFILNLNCTADVLMDFAIRDTWNYIKYIHQYLYLIAAYNYKCVWFAIIKSNITKKYKTEHSKGTWNYKLLVHQVVYLK